MVTTRRAISGPVPTPMGFVVKKGRKVLLAKHFAGDSWQSLSVPRRGSAEFNRKVAAGEASQR